MEMEFTGEFPGGSTAHATTHMIIRGKRTKRQRSSSPFTAGGAAVTSSSSSGGGGVVGGGSSIYFSIQSPATSSSDISASTEEDEDMANCLIMLSHSVSPIKKRKTEKLSSRRFAEMSTSTTGGKAGFYVYECKTCNRTFPSFQALGGHRASHKKPKAAGAAEEKKVISPPPPPPPFMELEEEEPHKKEDVQEEERKVQPQQQQQYDKSISSFLSSPPGGFFQNPNKGGKIHECSICGSEFLSGQALGGHMRRHRTTPPPSSSVTTKITMNIDTTDKIIEKPSRSLLSLDLNLPAPEDDHYRHLVFPSPALVDCHY